jgi:RHS repeat-associated protein
VTKYAQQVAGLGSGWQGTSATWADLNSSNAVQTRRMSLDAVDTVFARMGSDGSEAWYLADHLGSERGLMDNTGTLRDSINYDAFGNATESNPSYGDRFKWTGQEFDSSTNLQLNGMRYYDPATGRWTSQDPLGFGGGDSNLYRYATNSPVGNVDPTGMSENPEEVFLGYYVKLLQSGISQGLAGEAATLLTGLHMQSIPSGYSHNEEDLRNPNYNPVDAAAAGFCSRLPFVGSSVLALRERLFGEIATRNHGGLAFRIGEAGGQTWNFALMLAGAQQLASAGPASAGTSAGGAGGRLFAVQGAGRGVGVLAIQGSRIPAAAVAGTAQMGIGAVFMAAPSQGGGGTSGGNAPNSMEEWQRQVQELNDKIKDLQQEIEEKLSQEVGQGRNRVDGSMQYLRELLEQMIQLNKQKPML